MNEEQQIVKNMLIRNQVELLLPSELKCEVEDHLHFYFEDTNTFRTAFIINLEIFRYNAYRAVLIDLKEENNEISIILGDHDTINKYVPLTKDSLLTQMLTKLAA